MPRETVMTHVDQYSSGIDKMLQAVVEVMAERGIRAKDLVLNVNGEGNVRERWTLRCERINRGT